MTSRRLIAVALAMAAIVADQVTKAMIVAAPGLAEDHSAIRVLPFFSLVHWHNKGVSFGMFNGEQAADIQRWVLICLTLAILGVLVRALARASEMLTIVSLGLIMGGAIGNLIDRFRLGSVTDFLYFHYQDKYDFPAFNVADSCVCIGVGLMLLDGLGAGRKKSASFSDV
jgi:signal peptidase II